MSQFTWKKNSNLTHLFAEQEIVILKTKFYLFQNLIAKHINTNDFLLALFHILSQAYGIILIWKSENLPPLYLLGNNSKPTCMIWLFHHNFQYIWRSWYSQITTYFWIMDFDFWWMITILSDLEFVFAKIERYRSN